MEYFVMLTGIFFLFYLMGFMKKIETIEFMNRDFTIMIKGFSIITVVWAHSGAGLGIGGIQFIAGIGVCLFLICSGYGLEMSYRKNGLKGFWRKRFINVALPFWIVELIGLLFTGNFNVESYIRDFFFFKPATSYGWFMQYIVVCYIIFFVIKKLAGSKQTKWQLLFLIVLFGFWFVLDSLFFVNPDMPFLRARQMMAFPFGMLMAEYKDTFRRFRKKTFLLVMIGGVVMGVFFMGITQLVAIKSLPYIVSNILSLFTVMPLATAVIAVGELAPLFFKSITLKWTGSVSYEIYLVHVFTLGIIQRDYGDIVIFVMVTVVLAELLHMAMNIKNYIIKRF